MKQLKRFLFALCLLSTVVACDDGHDGGDDIIWDIYPINIAMYVQDKDGNDLLSPLFEGNILDDDIYISYDGMKFPLGEDMSEQTMSRAYLAVLRGLFLGKYGNDYFLVFGEFDGAADWNDRFEIYWGDGSSDEISFTRNFEWGEDGSPEISNTALYLNNEKIEDKLIIIR